MESNDIVTRLRGRYCSHGNNYDGAWQPLEWPSSCDRCELDKQAADEIERLEAVSRRYKTALGMLWDSIDLNGIFLSLYPEFEQFVKEAHDYYMSEVLNEGGNP